MRALALCSVWAHILVPSFVLLLLRAEQVKCVTLQEPLPPALATSNYGVTQHGQDIAPLAPSAQLSSAQQAEHAVRP